MVSGSGMFYLIDTNLLLRSMDSNNAMHTEAVGAIQKLQEAQHQLHLVPQNLIEFWNVCTRPADRNGFGLSVAETKVECDRLQQIFPLLPETDAIYVVWEELVFRYEVKGVNVHDARLVAAMLVHGLTHILTFNGKDFRRYKEIEVVAPADALRGL